jgi:mannose-binding lectin 1
LDILFHDLSTFKQESEERQQAMMHYNHALAEHNKHLLEKILQDIEGKDYKQVLERIHDTVREGNQAVMVNMPEAVHHSKLFHPCHLSFCFDLADTEFFAVVKKASPRFGFFVFLVVAAQVMLLGSYVIYKRRIKSQPKKYL